MNHAALEPSTMSALVSSGGSHRFDTYGHRVLTVEEVSKYREEGFLRVPTLTRRSEIAWIGSMIDRLYANEGLAYGAIDRPTRRVPALLNTGVFRSCQAIARQLLGSTARYGNDRALYKEAHGSVGSPWHQDAGFHGKYSRHNSIVFWVPLHDVDTDNGCMQYIPLERNQAVLPHRPFFPNDPSSLMTDYVDDSKVVHCPLSAGGAMIHGALTLHTAHVNTSAMTRRIWTLTFRPWGRWGGLAPSRVVHVGRVIASDMMLRILR
jgi:hypothetical protein